MPSQLGQRNYQLKFSLLLSEQTQTKMGFQARGRGSESTVTESVVFSKVRKKLEKEGI
jgi:hypothetical protein